jgi:hypothetical protein
MRKVFLEDLPKKSGIGQNKGNMVIDWKMSIGILVPFIYENINGEIKIIDYEPKNQILHIEYKDKEIFKITTGNFQKCKLGKFLGKITDEFKIEINITIKDDRRDLNVISREYRYDKNNIQNKKWYKYHCNKCGYEGWMVEGDLIKDHGCRCCCHNPQIIIENINSIVADEETYWMVKYFQGGYEEAKLYSKCSTTRINPICPDCGRIKNESIFIYSIYMNHSIGCSCSDKQSYPNKLMFNILEQLHNPFISEYSPKWAQPKRYDFYFELDNNKYIVEMDGGWHNVDNLMTNQTAEESKKIDDYKDKLAKEHGVEVIRIDCQKSDLVYIKNNIIRSKLFQLFNLNNIDWKLAERFAFSNLVKLISTCKKENPNLSTYEIAKIKNLHPSTIIRYLKIGNDLGWCNYNPKEEKEKSRVKAIASTIKTCSKKIEIFKEGVSLGVFSSRSELERQSEKLFGVKLQSPLIAKVLSGKRKHHRGFTFKDVNDNISI